MRKKIVAGNWKMNNGIEETEKLIHAVTNSIASLNLENVRVIVAPSFVSLTTAIESVKNSHVEVAAQNMHQAKNGAFTGEISAEMLVSIGVKTVILGHSERRQYFGENDELIARKIDAALANNLEVIFCFGELLEERKLDNHLLEVGSQLKNTLFHLKPEDFKNIILAYEPVWAIGTGETATPEQAQEMHAFVRNVIAKKFGKEIADSVSILYGGSVKPSNAEEIFSKEDVDGGLIGGASLVAVDFVAIIEAI
ncbi:MAG: triose-phosphate isomerase [Flavobacteriia bacterium]|nr:triose-phosphate isomerase [Flavobacteriia bacterium]OIP48499.1 MAG: triose-phosphate isomerase [Flavobacteriaceae bacterium CG2_30_31_66]PIV97318.1 MAG: triose-phosphate isomerase [Flavobacteriaceae bacterium CG17_big_fil_post_rev_8_21_14_2_50_31_13]PIX11603.1 MAG: triose-phosphate isomerase [Flavobacteriaceae bacterium CG_4_8_14_3_um_filter_31_8]PIY15003.1 MAG: triose-phosphate isomerase [Flavobacteriaceae bacterium CG_4_10_14_3_um_filter_31_253]PIZ09634.1 MAG: triose-phosphate isomerase 